MVPSRPSRSPLAIQIVHPHPQLSPGVPSGTRESGINRVSVGPLGGCRAVRQKRRVAAALGATRQQVAFEVETLAELRELYAAAPDDHARSLLAFDAR